MGAAMLGSGMQETYFYIILSAMALVASLSFLFVRKPLPQDIDSVIYESVLTNAGEPPLRVINLSGMESLIGSPEI